MKKFDVDVLIEGSGWSGCYLAKQLEKEGFSVALVSHFQHFQSLHNHGMFSDGSMMAAFNEEMMVGGRAAFQAFQSNLEENKVSFSGKNNFCAFQKGTVQSKLQPALEKRNITMPKLITKDFPPILKGGVLETESDKYDVLEMNAGGTFDQEELFKAMHEKTKEKMIFGSITTIDSDQSGLKANKAIVQTAVSKQQIEINCKFVVLVTGTLTSQIVNQQLTWNGFSQKPHIEYDCEKVPMVCGRAPAPVLPEFCFYLPGQFGAGCHHSHNNEAYAAFSAMGRKQTIKTTDVVDDPKLEDDVVQDSLKLARSLIPNLPYEQMQWTVFGGWRPSPPVFKVLENAKNVFVGLPLNLIGPFLSIPKMVAAELKNQSISPSNSQIKVTEAISEIAKENPLPTIKAEMYERQLNWKSWNDFKIQHKL